MSGVVRPCQRQAPQARCQDSSMLLAWLCSVPACCADGTALLFACRPWRSQVFFAQLPNIEGSWLASSLGAATSFGYTAIAFGLCLAKGELRPKGTI